MQFNKQSTTIEEQIQLLKDRGMNVGAEETASRWLESVGYYRLSAYWLPFEVPSKSDAVRSKNFREGTTLDAVVDLYVFDRKLRLLVLEAIERVEVHVRSRWTYHMANTHGPHAHLNHALFTGGLNYAEQLVRLARSVEKSKETFIAHYKKKYTEPHSPPLWSVTELMTLGELSKWFQATRDNKIKSQVGQEMGLPAKELVEGVMHVLSFIRNICAHHGRLWNRQTVKRIPIIKRFKKDLFIVETEPGKHECDNRLYNALVVLLHLMDHQGTDSTMRDRRQKLLESRNSEELGQMGFPENWQNCPIWNSTKT